MTLVVMTRTRLLGGKFAMYRQTSLLLALVSVPFFSRRLHTRDTGNTDCPANGSIVQNMVLVAVDDQ